MPYSDRKLAGLLAFIGGVECLLGISLAEELYPGYSVSANYISDLGATCRTSCTIVEPSSIVFNASVAVLGGLTLAVSYFVYRFTRRRILTTFIFLAGVGAVGVGFFPETTGIFHSVFSLVVFLFGGLSAVFSSQILEQPVNFLSIILGITTLSALTLFLTGNYSGLGPGGMERLVAYPALLWFVGFGGYMMKS